jgi:hypothetical protein
MSERIKCPSCGAALLLPDSLRGSRGTCPRCLAEISFAEAERQPDAIQAERPERREELVRGQERGRYGRPDVDVRRDTRGTSVLVILLAVVGGIGVGCMGLGAFAGAESDYSGLLYLAVALLFLAGVSTLIVFLRSKGNPRAVNFRRVAVGTLALAGGLILTMFSVCVFFFIVCLASIAGMNHH